MKHSLFYLLSFLISCTIYLQAQRKDNWSHQGYPKAFQDTPRVKKHIPVFWLTCYDNSWIVPYYPSRDTMKKGGNKYE